MEDTAVSKVKVTERALVARLARKLATEGLQLKKCRSDSPWYNDMGQYYAVELGGNAVRERHIELEAWARKAGVLRGFEVLDQVGEK